MQSLHTNSDPCFEVGFFDPPIDDHCPKGSIAEHAMLEMFQWDTVGRDVWWIPWLNFRFLGSHLIADHVVVVHRESPEKWSTKCRKKMQVQIY